jgi:hypothetical protein
MPGRISGRARPDPGLKQTPIGEKRITPIGELKQNAYRRVNLKRNAVCPRIYFLEKVLE